MARFCRCGALMPCEQCSRHRPKKQREGTTGERGYDYQWQRLRARYLAHHPLCEDCDEQGMVKPASEVHHIATIADAPERRLDWANLVALCTPCHHQRHH